jgi:hypothetical protein
MYRLRILIAALALLAGGLACGGTASSFAPTATPTPISTATPTPTRTPTPTLPVNLTGTWQATFSNPILDPSTSGQVTLTIAQTGNTVTCMATSSVAPAMGSDNRCTVVVNSLVPTNNHIDVQFTIQFPPSQQYAHISAYFGADFISDDRRRMSGDFEMGWQSVAPAGPANGFKDGAQLFQLAP